MVNYAVFVLTSLFVTAWSAPPSVTKRYRSDYQYNERTDAFYKLHIESRRNSAVKSVCEVEGATLMVPATHEDIVQVHGMFKRYPDLGQFLWVASDGSDHHESAEASAEELAEQSADYSFSYRDLELMNHIERRYDYIDVSHQLYDEVWHGPSRAVTIRNCDVLTRGGEIEELPCYRQLPFVCKVDAKDAPYEPHCDVFADNYHYNATVGSCYSIRRWAASWNEAYTECRTEGAHLVVLNSEAEKTVVHDLMKASPRVADSQHSWYYFAGFRANKPVGNETVVYRTIFNQTLSEAGYASWSPGEPNNLGNEYCGTLFSSDGMLNDANCDHLYAFICEKEYHAQA